MTSDLWYHIRARDIPRVTLPITAEANSRTVFAGGVLVLGRFASRNAGGCRTYWLIKGLLIGFIIDAYTVGTYIYVDYKPIRKKNWGSNALTLQTRLISK